MKLFRQQKKMLAFVCAISLFGAELPQTDIHANAWNAADTKEQLKLRFWNDETPNYRFYLNAGERYILETVKEPNVGTLYGEWSVMDLLRGAYTGMDYLNYIPANYFTDYEKRVEAYVKDKDGILDRSKSTEWSRVALAMTALGHDISNVGGYDFVDQLSKSHKFSYKQGINGPVWEVIALNTGNYSLYETPSSFKEGDINTVGKMLDFICSKEITQIDGTVGGFALTGKSPDTDITSMALQALAPYYLDKEKYEKENTQKSYEEFCEVVERGILTLSKLQLENGGFGSYGTVNSESVSQVIVALTSLNIDPLAKQVSLTHIGETCGFIKNGESRDGVTTNNVLDALLSFYDNTSGSGASVGGFKHVTSGYDGGGDSGTTVNSMATDQAVYGLIAYDRYVKGKLPLYNMTDQKDGSYKTTVAKKYNVTFDGNGKDDTKESTYSPFAEIVLTNEGMAENFVGWNTKADGSGTMYVSGEILSMPEQDICLYAIYENGGTLATPNPESTPSQAPINTISPTGTNAVVITASPTGGNTSGGNSSSGTGTTTGGNDSSGTGTTTGRSDSSGTGTTTDGSSSSGTVTTPTEHTTEGSATTKPVTNEPENTMLPVISQSPVEQTTTQVTTATPGAVIVNEDIIAKDPVVASESSIKVTVAPTITPVANNTNTISKDTKKIKEKVVIKKVSKYKTTGILVKLKKAVKHADGYVLFVYKGKKTAKPKKYFFKGLAKKVTKQKKKTVYYIRVCGYKVDEYGNKVYGPFSTWKKVKL